MPSFWRQASSTALSKPNHREPSLWPVALIMHSKTSAASLFLDYQTNYLWLSLDFVPLWSLWSCSACPDIPPSTREILLLPSSSYGIAPSKPGLLRCPVGMRRLGLCALTHSPEGETRLLCPLHNTERETRPLCSHISKKQQQDLERKGAKAL